MNTETRASVEEMNEAIHNYMDGEWTIIRETEGGHIERILFESTDFDKAVFLCDDQIRITGKQYKVVPYLPRFEYKYHSSWDALMPVFLKILKWGVEYNGVQWEQAIDQDGVRMSDCRNGKLRVGSFNPRGTVGIENVHSAVYDFVSWYNNQNQLTPENPL